MDGKTVGLAQLMDEEMIDESIKFIHDSVLIKMKVSVPAIESLVCCRLIIFFLERSGEERGVHGNPKRERKERKRGRAFERVKLAVGWISDDGFEIRDFSFFTPQPPH